MKTSTSLPDKAGFTKRSSRDPGKDRKKPASALLAEELDPALLAPFPVLSTSQLCLDLMLRGKALNLRQAIELLGRDPGAVLRIFSAIARDFPDPLDRPGRLDECVMSLDTNHLVASLQTPACDRREQVALVPFARHAYLISQYARVAADSLGLDVEKALLIGLLHALGELPAALGRGPLPSDPQALSALAATISQMHHLPSEVVAGVSAVACREPDSVWTALIGAAYDLVPRTRAGWRSERNVLKEGGPESSMRQHAITGEIPDPSMRRHSSRLPPLG